MNLSNLIMDFSDVLHELFKIDTSSSCCYMDLSKSIHRFLLVVTWIVKIDTWIAFRSYMDDLFKLIHGFVTVVRGRSYTI